MGIMVDGEDIKNRDLRQLLETKARRRVMAILIVGVVLIVCDFIIATSSSSSLYKNSKGIFITRPLEAGRDDEIRLRAKVKAESGTYDKSYDIVIKPYNEDAEDSEDEIVSDEEDSNKELVGSEMRSLLSDVNSDLTLKKIYLPSKLSTGDKINWSVEKQNNTGMLICLALGISMAVYLNRFKPLKKKKKAEQDSVLRQLPEFVNRLLLLLNAGLILNSAFLKSIEDGLKYNNSNDDYFYSRMGEIYNSVLTTNAMVDRELTLFAKEVGVNELLRVSNIITDNISKGVNLTDKLQRENEVLWESRKRQCEERGRLSETKLTLPLTLFLVVLILISVSPALMKL